MSDVVEDAKGRWPSILSSLGVDSTFLRNRQGPCPVCGGKDRFRFDDKDGAGSCYCNQCGKMDGFDLVQRVNNWDFKRSADEVKRLVGTAPVATHQPKIAPERAKKERNAIWTGSHRIEAVEATRRWWVNRVGEVPDCTDLRGADELYHAPSKRRFPAMLALVRDVAGRPVQLHRTYLTAAGAKAPVQPCRMLMPSIAEGEMNGASVHLVRRSELTDRIGIAEGIETAVAATILTGVPCWAALNAGNLERWVPPSGLAVTIFADNDDSYTGEASAYLLAKRLRAQGIDVDDQRPSTRGEDWNDVLRVHRQMNAEAAA